MKKVLDYFVGALMMIVSSLALGRPTIELVVPYGAGGASDLVARKMAPYLSSQLDTSVVVINKPGAHTKIGTNYVLNKEANGHTLILISSWVFLNPSQYLNPGFKIEDFDFLSPFGHTPIVLAVKANSPIRSWDDFLIHAKKHNLNCGAHGEVPKFLGRLLVKKLDMPNLQVVDFRTYGDHMTAMLGGTIDCGIATKQEFMQSHTNQDIRIIAVSSPGTTSDLPNAELFQNIDKGLAISAIYSVGVATTTPSATKQQVLSGVLAAVHNPEFLQDLRKIGIDIYPGRADLDGQKWAKERFQKLEDLRQTAGIEKQ